MMAWLGLGASLAWNYAQHRRHRATICSVSRRLPKSIVIPAYTAGAISLGVHVARGYRAIIDP